MNMKAIAKTPSGVLVEMTESEFKLITGRDAYSPNRGGYAQLNTDTLDVGGLAYEFDKARRNREKLREASAELRALATLLDGGIEGVDKMMEPDQPGEVA
jgi:hypothetical protein